MHFTSVGGRYFPKVAFGPIPLAGNKPNYTSPALGPWVFSFNTEKHSWPANIYKSLNNRKSFGPRNPHGRKGNWNSSYFSPHLFQTHPGRTDLVSFLEITFFGFFSLHWACGSSALIWNTAPNRKFHVPVLAKHEMQCSSACDQERKSLPYV